MSGRTFFTMGIILVLLGLQFRAVDTFVLNQKASEFVEQRVNQNNPIRSENSFNRLMLDSAPSARKQLTHPRWVGLALLSVGVVFLLQGIARRAE